MTLEIYCNKNDTLNTGSASVVTYSRRGGTECKVFPIVTIEASLGCKGSVGHFAK
jgi:hypothetical protein